MPNITKKSRYSILAILILVPLYGLVTGGMTYGKKQWFGGQRSIQLEDGTKVGLRLDPTNRQWDLPFLAHFQGSTPPYTLHIFVPEPDPTWVSAEINEVLVEYEDGSTDWEKGRGIDWRKGEREMALYRGLLKNLVKRYESCKVTVTGSISKENGVITKFTFSHEFEVKPEESYLVPYWWVMGQGG